MNPPSSDNWGYPTGPGEKYAPPEQRTPQPNSIQRGNAPRCTPIRKKIKLACVICVLVISVGSAAQLVDSASFTTLLRLIRDTTAGSQAQAPYPAQRDDPARTTSIQREQIWDCGGSFTDKPAPNDVCFSVDAESYKDGKGNKFFSAPW